MLMRRRQLMIGILVGAGTTSAVGLIGSRYIKSPQQLAADTAAPPLSTLTAQVERRVLKDTVVIRGRVGAGGSFEVTPVPAGAVAPVVTRVQVRAGDEIQEAKAFVEVAGRPLFGLRGGLPVYRDLRPGDSGQDVAQLQQALEDLGHQPKETGGMFGSGTKLAVTRLYRDLGYEPMIAGDEASLETASREVTTAQRALAAARDRLQRAQSNAPSPAPGEPDPVAQARLEVQYAQEDLGRATAARNKVFAAFGPMVPAAEVVFLPSFPARVDALNGEVGKAVKAPLIILSSGALVVRAKLNAGQGDLLRTGMAVDIQSELLGLTAKGKIDSVGEIVQDQTSGRHFPVLITAAADPFDPKLTGQDVRLTVEAASTNGEVLVVPLAALYSGADGRTAVQVVRDDNGKTERVEIIMGASGDGYIAVTPVDGSLSPGDRVTIGARPGTEQ